MADEKEDFIEVEVEVEASDKDEPSPKAEKSESKAAAEPQEKDDVENQSETVRRRIDKLTYRLREAERREQAALEYAKGLKTEVETVRHKSDILDQTLVSEFDHRLKVQNSYAKDKLKQAIDMNDVDGQIEAQRMMASLAVEDERLRVQKVRREQEQRNPPRRAPEYVPPQPQVQADPKAQAWADKNEWFGADEVMTLAAFNFHKKLVEVDGYDPTGDDYYRELDRRMRTEFPHKMKPAQAKRPAQSPVGSARGTSTSPNRRQISLSPSQVAIAKRLGVSLEEYARQTQKLSG
tara:strand:+ start:1118 stop:1996 length:879 start_codon:yes stop_codon:yes gene_type:complete